MKAGFSGAFVISWSQTEIDGLGAAGPQSLLIGATWRWKGEAVRVDGPGHLAVLSGSQEVADLHSRAARNVQRLIGSLPGVRGRVITPDVGGDPLMEHSFTVTDGRTAWRGTLIEGADGGLIMFTDGVPPKGADLWIARVETSSRAAKAAAQAVTAGGVICFTEGTRISTPDGVRQVQDLREGDMVLTADNGAQPLVWTGSRRMSGARLRALPHLRPIRIRSGVLGPDVPDGDLLVSPSHRMVVRGPAAQALFGTPEVLIRARDLEGAPGIGTDLRLAEATYVHLMLDQHQVLFANGVQSESFHPAEADLASLSEADRERLLGEMPQLEQQPESYGEAVRRALTAPEAAIFRHDTTRLVH
ncbi:Hint domain-containing protein [Alphaproteobacteria bacterium KMM 3653]|uniref:Hint domain-containing protein n=1 Tax=Harenicola maris TaxID=2841044 RepID=A0AAP2CPN6_9RHOB|nr:Hint domain-containing protein [Harenicola maris]